MKQLINTWKSSAALIKSKDTECVVYSMWKDEHINLQDDEPREDQLHPGVGTDQ
jgi:hypothetical protein